MNVFNGEIAVRRRGYGFVICESLGKMDFSIVGRENRVVPRIPSLVVVSVDIRRREPKCLPVPGDRRFDILNGENRRDAADIGHRRRFGKELMRFLRNTPPTFAQSASGAPMVNGAASKATEKSVTN